MILSIIIPVYGVEKYIADCIQSCIDNIGNSSSEVEVLIIDDGSKDRSIDIAREKIRYYPYFRIVSQINQGLSMARNNGLDYAQGDYVWFIDSDDFISVGVVDMILDAISRFCSIDIFELRFQCVEESIERISLPIISSKIEQYNIETGKEHFLKGFDTPVPFHVFRRAFLNDNGFRMYPGIYHEDCEFTPRVIWSAQCVAVLPEVSYYYRQRGCSIMTTSNPQKGENYAFVAHRLKDFFDGQNADTEEQRAINDYIAMAYCNGLHNVIGANGEDRKRVSRAAYEHRSVLKCLKGAIQKKYRVLGTLGTIAPRHIADIYQLMMLFKKH